MFGALISVGQKSFGSFIKSITNIRRHKGWSQENIYWFPNHSREVKTRARSVFPIGSSVRLWSHCFLLKMGRVFGHFKINQRDLLKLTSVLKLTFNRQIRTCGLRFSVRNQNKINHDKGTKEAEDKKLQIDWLKWNTVLQWPLQSDLLSSDIPLNDPSHSFSLRAEISHCPYSKWSESMQGIHAVDFSDILSSDECQMYKLLVL